MMSFMMRACLLVAMVILCSACLTYKTHELGGNFSEVSEQKDFPEGMLSELAVGLGKTTERDLQSRFGKPHQSLDTPQVRVVGWSFDLTKGRSVNLWVYEREKGRHHKAMLSCAMDSEGHLLDFYYWSSRQPYQTTTWQTQPIVQGLAGAIVAYRLADLLETTLERAGTKLEGKAKKQGGKLLDKLHEYYEEEPES